MSCSVLAADIILVDSYILAVLYCYAMVICAFAGAWYCIVYYAYPLTDYTGIKFPVPVWNYQEVLINFIWWLAVIPLCGGFFFYNASFWESGVKTPGKEDYAYPFAPTVAAVYYAVAVICIFMVPTSLLYSHLDVDLYFYFNLYGLWFNIPAVVVVLTYLDVTRAWFEFCMKRPPRRHHRASVSPAGRASQQAGSRKQRRRSSMMAMEDQIRDLREMGNEEEATSSRTAENIATLAMLGSILLSVIYPVIFLPIFISDSVDDSIRIFIVTVLHSVLVEVTLLVNRYAKIDVQANPDLAVQMQWALLQSEMGCKSMGIP